MFAKIVIPKVKKTLNKVCIHSCAMCMKIHRYEILTMNIARPSRRNTSRFNKLCILFSRCTSSDSPQKDYYEQLLLVQPLFWILPPQSGFVHVLLVPASQPLFQQVVFVPYPPINPFANSFVSDVISKSARISPLVFSI